jgi:hypothetical protein
MKLFHINSEMMKKEEAATLAAGTIPSITH